MHSTCNAQGTLELGVVCKAAREAHRCCQHTSENGIATQHESVVPARAVAIEFNRLSENRQRHDAQREAVGDTGVSLRHPSCFENSTVLKASRVVQVQ